MSYTQDLLYGLNIIVMLSLYQILQCQRIHRLVIRPAKHLVIQLQLRIGIYLRKEIEPLPGLLRSWVYGQVQWVYGLCYVVAGECALSLRDSVHVTPVLGRYRFSALCTDDATLSDHFLKIVLRIWHIKVRTVFTSYDPLCLG